MLKRSKYDMPAVQTFADPNMRQMELDAFEQQRQAYNDEMSRLMAEGGEITETSEPDVPGFAEGGSVSRWTTSPTGIPPPPSGNTVYPTPHPDGNIYGDPVSDDREWYYADGKWQKNEKFYLDPMESPGGYTPVPIPDPVTPPAFGIRPPVADPRDSRGGGVRQTASEGRPGEGFNPSPGFARAMLDAGKNLSNYPVMAPLGMPLKAVGSLATKYGSYLSTVAERNAAAENSAKYGIPLGTLGAQSNRVLSQLRSNEGYGPGKDGPFGPGNDGLGGIMGTPGVTAGVGERGRGLMGTGTSGPTATTPQQAAAADADRKSVRETSRESGGGGGEGRNGPEGRGDPGGNRGGWGRGGGYAKGGSVSMEDILGINAETLSDEQPEDVINTNPVGTAQQMLADLSGAGKPSPTRQSIKRTKTASGGGAESDKAMQLIYEDLAKGDLGAMKDRAPAARNTESARSQMEELARIYQLKIKSAQEQAKGLSANTFGALTLEGPTLTKSKLTKKRFKEGGEAKKSDVEGAKEPGIFSVNSYATDTSARMFPDQAGQDDERDAARHMLAAAVLSKKVGPDVTEFLGKAYERMSNPESFFSMFGIGKPRDDYELDVHNNKLGVDLGSRTTSQAELEKLVQAMAKQAQTKQVEGKPYIMGREQMDARKAKAEKGMTPPPEYRAEGSPVEGERASELTGVNRVLDSIAKRLPADSFPTSVRTLLETVQGKKEPITESNFSPKELSVLRQLIESTGGRGNVQYDDYTKFMRQQQQEKGTIPGSITPGPLSILDPIGNVQTTLGRFAYARDAAGNLVINDNYDFNPIRPMSGAYGALRNYAAEKIPPGKGREVRINLGKPIERAKGSPEEGEESLDKFYVPKARPSTGLNRKKGPVSEALDSGEAYVNMAKGVTELPYDILGAPVDVATMLMRPFGYTAEKPIMGSDFIKEKMTQAGIRQAPPADPTAKGFYTAGQLLSNMTNPAGVTRAAVKGAKKTGQAAKDAARTLEDLTVGEVQRARVRKAGRKAQDIPDTAYDSLRERLEATGNLALAVRPDEIKDLIKAVRDLKGNYGARRVERAADEIPNLEELFEKGALGEVFTGDNAQALITLKPADFEQYALELTKNRKSDVEPSFSGVPDKYTTTTDQYVDYLSRLQGGFKDVPYLNLYKDEVGLPVKPEVKGHEGRHRNRALAERGERTSLVKINPRGDLREGLPRRTQEEYIEALKEELERSGRLVLPERQGPSFPFRPAIKLPDVYAKGGEVDKNTAFIKAHS